MLNLEELTNDSQILGIARSGLVTIVFAEVHDGTFIVLLALSCGEATLVGRGQRAWGSEL